MKTYTVLWEKGEEEFADIRSAIDFAEKKCMATVSDVYIWRVVDGDRDKEPFYSCLWSW